MTTWCNKSHCDQFSLLHKTKTMAAKSIQKIEKKNVILFVASALHFTVKMQIFSGIKLYFALCKAQKWFLCRWKDHMLFPKVC